MKIFVSEKGEVLFSSETNDVKSAVGVSARIDASEQEIAFESKGNDFIEDTYQVIYENQKISAKAEIVPFANSRAIRQHTTYTANVALTLTRAAGANVHGVCFSEEGISSRLNDGSILVHYCVSRWQGEGQWRSATPENLGLYPATGHGWESRGVVFSPFPRGVPPLTHRLLSSRINFAVRLGFLRLNVDVVGSLRFMRTADERE